MRSPAFWWKARGLSALALSPLGALYGLVAGARMMRAGAKGDVPVICIGDPTVGGAGKTPTAIAVAHILRGSGETPFFLTRGYGGSAAGPLVVDAASHGAEDVGDEPLLLAGTAPVVVSADRVAGAALAAKSGASVIVMDDGFQNPALQKDVSLLVVDAGHGAGNGLVFPAGPLRAPLGAQIARADGIVLIGRGETGEEIARRAVGRGKVVLRARIEPDAASLGTIQEVFAYAGIGRPEKFFSTLEQAGCAVVERRAFPDHHVFSEAEARELLDAARMKNLTLVTTEKDRARMSRNPRLAELAAASHVLPIALRFDDEETAKNVLRKALAR